MPNKRTKENVLSKRNCFRLIFFLYLFQCIQTLYFGITVLNDFCGSNVRPSEKGQKISSMQKFRDYFLATLVFPVGMVSHFAKYLEIGNFIRYCHDCCNHQHDWQIIFNNSSWVVSPYIYTYMYMKNIMQKITTS